LNNRDFRRLTPHQLRGSRRSYKLAKIFVGAASAAKLGSMNDRDFCKLTLHQPRG